MGKLDALRSRWSELFDKAAPEEKAELTTYGKIKKVIGIIVMCFYRLRKVFLAIPVVYYALKLAAYNAEHLPEEVGFNLLSSGEFAAMISRQAAVSGPLMVTCACLVLMFVSRKALYPWAVSLFTLILPVLLLISNLYPA